MIKVARSLSHTLRKILSRADSVSVSRSVVPRKDLRWCGPEFKDDTFYLHSAEQEAHRLVTHFGCGRHSRVLDVGCGQGRLPIGILRVIGEIHYVGLDVDRPSVDWCRRHIQKDHPSFVFEDIDIGNERYNPQGRRLNEDFRFNLGPERFDIVYLFSVFSHMTEGDMRVYLKEFARLLTDGGKVFFTTFVEENVPAVAINPEGYVFKKYVGPLHVVRYDKHHLFALLEELGYGVEDFTHRTEADGQSAIYLSKE
jgi:SAM-dependent methyltransferase